MRTRRSFLRDASMAASSILVSGIQEEEDEQRLVILHTNDMHSRLDPFPRDAGRNAGMGGIAARAQMIKEIRASNEHVLLFDAGDIFQGTPYFNYYKGEPEIKAMTMMGYDAVTMGNHDFDAGLENFANQLSHARFPVLISNYDFLGTEMESKHLPYKILKKGRMTIGVTGVGIELQGLVPENLYGKTRYLDPIEQANKVAYELKKNQSCDLVVCLSHLGYRYDGRKVSDTVLAKESENIDLIIGGHTHTFLDAPVKYKNKRGSDVIVNQVGWGGIILGRMDIGFRRENKKNLMGSHTIAIGKKMSE